MLSYASYEYFSRAVFLQNFFSVFKRIYHTVSYIEKFNFNIYISEISKKEGRKLNVLKKLSQFLNESCLKSIYKSLNSYTFEYAPIDCLLVEINNPI